METEKHQPISERFLEDQKLPRVKTGIKAGDDGTTNPGTQSGDPGGG